MKKSNRINQGEVVDAIMSAVKIEKGRVDELNQDQISSVNGASAAATAVLNAVNTSVGGSRSVLNIGDIATSGMKSKDVSLGDIADSLS
jgi:hypothetical protein